MERPAYDCACCFILALFISVFRVTGGELFEDIVAREYYSESDARLVCLLIIHFDIILDLILASALQQVGNVGFCRGLFCAVLTQSHIYLRIIQAFVLPPEFKKIGNLPRFEIFFFCTFSISFDDAESPSEGIM